MIKVLSWCAAGHKRMICLDYVDEDNLPVCPVCGAEVSITSELPPNADRKASKGVAKLSVKRPNKEDW